MHISFLRPDPERVYFDTIKICPKKENLDGKDFLHKRWISRFSCELVFLRMYVDIDSFIDLSLVLCEGNTYSSGNISFSAICLLSG